MSPQTRFCPLGVLELNDPDTLDGLFSDAEKPGGHLRDHMVVIRFQFVRISPFPCTAEGPQGGSGLYPAEHGRNTHRAIGHPAPVKGDLNPDPVGIVIPPVQGNTHVYLTVIVPFSLFPVFLPEDDAQLVKPASGATDPVFKSLRRDVAEFRHMPGTDQEIRGPPIVPH